MKTKIKSATEVEEFAVEVDAFAAETKERVTKLEADQQEIASVKTAVGAMEETMKSFHTLIKVKNAIEKEDTEESRLYKLGKFVTAMIRKDGREVNRLGGTPTQERSPGEFDIRKGYEDIHSQRVKAYWEKAALSTDPMSSDDTDSGNFYGSYIVPVDTIAEVMRVAADSSVMMNLVTRRPVRGLTTYQPTSTDAFTFTKVTNQETAKTEDNWTWARATLTVCTYAFWIAITEEMDEDSLIALGAFIRDMTGEAWGSKFDTLCLSDSTYGAMAASGINQLIMSVGDTSFQNLSTYYLDELIKKLTTQAKRRGARFFMSPSVWDYPANELDSNGNYKLRRFSDAEPLQARGYPVLLTDGMPATSSDAVSTDFVAFGNPRYLINGEKTGLEFRIFDQTESTMKYDQIFLRARVRQAFVNAIPSAWAKLTTAAN